MKMKFLILTISDTCFKDPTKDASGPALVEEVKITFPESVQQLKIIPDDRELIIKELLFSCDIDKVNAIFTTGGTGPGPRDVTPEATTAVIQRQAHAFATVMTVESLKFTPMAALSRAVSGIRGNTLIVNFPGSVKAVKQCFRALTKALPHAMSLIQNEAAAVQNAHNKMNGNSYAGHVCPHANISKVDITKVALRQRESPYPMLQVADAMRIVENEMSDIVEKKIKTLPLKQCLGRALAVDICAKEPLPPFPASVKDGYACISADGKGSRRVRGAVCAGDVAEERLCTGECVRVNTGAPLPPGADCVVQVEDTKLLKYSEDCCTEHEIEILKIPKAGEDVRQIGHDISEGETVVRSGAVLDAGNIGILATVGVVKVPVFVQPTIGLLSTGNELQHPDEEKLEPGHIRDSNKTMLIALLREHNFECVDCGISKDDPISMKKALAGALDRVDVLITTGSVSMGERDMLKPVLAKDFNGIIHFGRTNMKPGKPTTFATCTHRGKKKYIFGLPGNPVSAYVTSLLFAVPALRRCAGLRAEWVEMPVTLATPVKLDPRPEYARATLQFKEGSPQPIVTIIGNQCSSRLLSTCGAAVLVSLPGATDALTHLEPGATLTALLTTRLRPT